MFAGGGEVKTAQPVSLQHQGSTRSRFRGGGGADGIKGGEGREEVWEGEPPTHRDPGPAGQTPAGLSVPVGNASGRGIIRLEVCAGSFPVSWMGPRVPRGLSNIPHRCFCPGVFWTSLTLNIALPNVHGPCPIR